LAWKLVGGSHFLGRALREQGHDVRQIPAQYVKPYVKTNKSDYIDAAAIAEAIARSTMRFVPIKTDDQLDMRSLHRVRERWVMRRTTVINQIRGLLLERGITLRKGRHHVDAALPLILEDADANLSGAMRLLLAQLKLDLDQLSVRIDEADAVIQKTLMRTKPAGGSWPSLASDQSRPPHSSRRSATEGLPQGAGVRSVDGGGSLRTLQRWPAEAAGHQQTWELLLAKTVRARRTCGNATTYEAVFRSEYLAGTAHIAHAPQRRRRGASEQTRPHSLGCAREE